MTGTVRLTLFGLACCGVLLSASADPDTDKLAAAVRAKDAEFWNAYNTCDLTRIHEFFTSDVESYHDKGGPTIGRDALIEILKANLCGTSGWRLRRAVVPGTEAIFPLRRGNETYGGILSGEHVFYVSEPGKKEYLDGRANYTHLWLKLTKPSVLELRSLTPVSDRGVVPELRRALWRSENPNPH